MDIARPDIARKKRLRQSLYAVFATVVVALVTVGIARLQPAAPRIDRDIIYLDTVQRGPLIRQVRGIGTLVPEQIRWIPATTDGNVERIVIRPGANINPDTVVVELSNPELEQRALETKLNLDAGQRVTAGTNLARVGDPTILKAELRIAETQAMDIQIGQKASIDTRNGVIPGHVTRIDPAVENGTVMVDVALDGALPRGARPDLTVDGTIELERLDDIIFVDRPVFGREDSVVSLFKVETDGTHAARTRVGLGRASVNAIEVLEGLQPGDRVVLSDMSTSDRRRLHAERPAGGAAQPDRSRTHPQPRDRVHLSKLQSHRRLDGLRERRAPVRRIRVEAPLDPIRCRAGLGIPACRARAAALAHPGDAGGPHDPGDPRAAHRDTGRGQFGVHPRSTIRPSTAAVNRLDASPELGIGPCPSRRRTTARTREPGPPAHVRTEPGRPSVAGTPPRTAVSSSASRILLLPPKRIGVHETGATSSEHVAAAA